VSEGQKTAVIFGLANKRSIAWAIAQKLHQAGWRLAITYQNDRLEQEAKDLITDLPGSEGFMCDVSSDEEIAKLFAELQGRYGVLHGLVHSVAYAPAEDLKGDFVNTSREGFRIAHDISVYSLIAVVRAAAPLMTEGGALLTLTYLGATRVMPNYNVMGVAKASLEAAMRYLASDLGPQKIRVNAISAGPVKTASMRAVKDATSILDVVPQRAPLRHNTDPAEVADAIVHMASLPLSTNILTLTIMATKMPFVGRG